MKLLFENWRGYLKEGDDEYGDEEGTLAQKAAKLALSGGGESAIQARELVLSLDIDMEEVMDAIVHELRTVIFELAKEHNDSTTTAIDRRWGVARSKLIDNRDELARSIEAFVVGTTASHPSSHWWFEKSQLFNMLFDYGEDIVDDSYQLLQGEEQGQRWSADYNKVKSALLDQWSKSLEEKQNNEIYI